MSEILLLNKKTEVTFTKFPSYEEITLIKAVSPELRTVVFEDSVIPDFSLLKNLVSIILYLGTLKF